ncbi:GDYXXLXY domain-containing protein [Lysobacter brunescens]|uniref:GDYXXLXY domain-containing protein n=1 Tax=Lysobacter brunescens TaxID=262323 RepID=A0ABW2Y8U8_9GAMM
MTHWRNLLLWGGLLLALVVANLGIRGHERTLSEGRVVLLELAPVDPRSLMQGDYMVLRFAVDEAIRDAQHPERRSGSNATALWNMDDSCGSKGCSDGYVVVVPDRDGVGRFVRIQDAPQRLAEGEIALQFRVRKWFQIVIAGNSWFFPEGQAKRYEPARYAELRVASDGTALIAGLRDEKRRPL